MNEIAQSTPEELLKKVKEDDTFKAADVTPDTENGKKVSGSQWLAYQIKAIVDQGEQEYIDSKIPPVSSTIHVDRAKERMTEVIFGGVERNDGGERIFDTRMGEEEFDKREATMILEESMPAIEELTLPLRDFLSLNANVTDLQISAGKTEYSFKYFGEVCDIQLKDFSTYINGEEESNREQIVYDLQCIVFEKLLSQHIDLVHLSPVKNYHNCFILDEKVQDILIQLDIIRNDTPNTMCILDTDESTKVIFYSVDPRYSYTNFDPRRHITEVRYPNIENVLKKLSGK